MPKQREMTISVAQARALQAERVDLRTATLHQAMGPYEMDLIWVQNPGSPHRHAYVSKTHTHKQITAILSR